MNCIHKRKNKQKCTKGKEENIQIKNINEGKQKTPGQRITTAKDNEIRRNYFDRQKQIYNCTYFKSTICFNKDCNKSSANKTLSSPTKISFENYIYDIESKIRILEIEIAAKNTINVMHSKMNKNQKEIMNDSELGEDNVMQETNEEDKGERVNCCHKLNNTNENIVINLFTDIISTVIDTSTLEEDEKYVSDDSHPSNLSVPNVFNPSEDIVLNLFTDLISTAIETSTLEDDEKYVSDNSHPSHVSVPNVFNPSEDIVLKLFTDLISTVVETSTLEEEEKYVSYESPPEDNYDFTENIIVQDNFEDDPTEEYYCHFTENAEDIFYSDDEDDSTEEEQGEVLSQSPECIGCSHILCNQSMPLNGTVLVNHKQYNALSHFNYLIKKGFNFQFKCFTCLKCESCNSTVTENLMPQECKHDFTVETEHVGEEHIVTADTVTEEAGEIFYSDDEDDFIEEEQGDVLLQRPQCIGCSHIHCKYLMPLYGTVLVNDKAYHVLYVSKYLMAKGSNFQFKCLSCHKCEACVTTATQRHSFRMLKEEKENFTEQQKDDIIENNGFQTNNLQVSEKSKKKKETFCNILHYDHDMLESELLSITGNGKAPNKKINKNTKKKTSTTTDPTKNKNLIKKKTAFNGICAIDSVINLLRASSFLQFTSKHTKCDHKALCAVCIIRSALLKCEYSRTLKSYVELPEILNNLWIFLGPNYCTKCFLIFTNQEEEAIHRIADDHSVIHSMQSLKRVLDNFLSNMSDMDTLIDYFCLDLSCSVCSETMNKNGYMILGKGMNRSEEVILQTISAMFDTHTHKNHLNASMDSLLSNACLKI